MNLADREPLVALIDDCQWADRDSLRFLAYLAQRTEGLALTIVLAGRPPEPTDTEAGAVWSLVGSRAEAVVLYAPAHTGRGASAHPRALGPRSQ